MVVMRRVSARNNAVASSNRMHDDVVAQDFGFRGGLVPGADVWAYVAHPLVEAWGAGWLAEGSMELRFEAPFYEADEVVVEMSPPPDAPEAEAVAVRAVNATGTVCASGRATRRDGGAVPRIDDFPLMPLPDVTPPASREHFEANPILGTLHAPWSADNAQFYLDSVDEDAALLRDGGIAPPGWFARLTDFVLVANVTLGPWIFAQARLQHLGLVHDGDVVAARAKVASLYERRGHHFVDLGLLFTVGERPVLCGRKTAIYQPRRAAD